MNHTYNNPGKYATTAFQNIHRDGKEPILHVKNSILMGLVVHKDV